MWVNPAFRVEHCWGPLCSCRCLARSSNNWVPGWIGALREENTRLGLSAGVSSLEQLSCPHSSDAALLKRQAEQMRGAAAHHIVVR